VSLPLDGQTDRGQVAGLIREAYRQEAFKRMLRTLDAQR
jgi:hypothetical protein